MNNKLRKRLENAAKAKGLTVEEYLAGNKNLVQREKTVKEIRMEQFIPITRANINEPHTIPEWRKCFFENNPDCAKYQEMFGHNEILIANLHVSAFMGYLGKKARKGLVIAPTNIVEVLKLEEDY